MDARVALLMAIKSNKDLTKRLDLTGGGGVLPDGLYGEGVSFSGFNYMKG